MLSLIVKRSDRRAQSSEDDSRRLREHPHETHSKIGIRKGDPTPDAGEGYGRSDETKTMRRWKEMMEEKEKEKEKEKEGGGIQYAPITIRAMEEARG